MLTEHRTNRTESLSKAPLTKAVAALCNFGTCLTVPGEFVHKKTNSETAEEKAERRDHNDEGYFAYSSSDQILEKFFFYILLFKNNNKNNETIKNCKQRLNRIPLSIQLVNGPRPKERTQKKFFSRTPIFY